MVCIRSFQLTQKASKMEFKAIESVLQTINPHTGEVLSPPLWPFKLLHICALQLSYILLYPHTAEKFFQLIASFVLLISEGLSQLQMR